MGMIAAQEIKRRGISAVDTLAESGPVYVIKNNKPAYVVLSLDNYNSFMDELSDARIAASEADIAAGRVTKGTASELLRDIMG